MDFQPPPPPPPQSYMRPPAPPPSMADPHQRLPPPPPQQPWYSTNQFHYPSPPPPPPHQQQQPWAPPPYPSAHPPYPAHHYPPPPPYPQVNQDWAYTNVNHHQNWEYRANNQEEDWAAKARAWAAAKAENDTQQSQVQVTHAGQEDHSHYHQFAQPIESHYTDTQKSSLPPSGYQHHQVPGASQYQSSLGNSQQFASFDSGQPSYGNLAGDTAAAFPQQENSSINHFVHPPEVSSSYSSIAGKEDAGETGKYYMSSSLPVALGPQHAQLSLPLAARSLSMEEPRYTYPGHQAEPATNLSDRPLEFAPRFNSYESHVQSPYPASDGPVRGVDSTSSGPSNYNWAPPGSGVVYPPVSPVLPSASQVNPPRAISPPVPVHPGPIYGRLTAPGFQATSASDAPFSAGAGAALQPAGAFSYDTFGISSAPERPKKAPVPNWLREEIIKNKAVISSSAPEFPRDDNHSVDETIDRSYGKGEQEDSKSIDSSRSTEEDDNDEDAVETARTATINQEIKRVLTEVLLKVTDNLFDEIATEVLNEGNLTAEDDHSLAAPNNEVPTSTQAAPLVKAEAKVLVPAKVTEDDSDDANEKSTSSSRGDVLGLANYASDDEDDNIKSPAKPNPQEKANHLEFTSDSNSTDKNLVENGVPLKGFDAHGDKAASQPDVVNHSDVVTQSRNDRPTGELVQGDDRPSSRVKSVNAEKEVLERLVTSISKGTAGEKVIKTERLGESKLLGMDHPEDGETRSNSDRRGRREIGRSSVDHDYVKEESRKDKHEKEDKSHRGREGKHEKKERTDHQNGSKDKAKEEGLRSGDKVKDSGSRKRASPDEVKKSKTETEKVRKSDKEDNVRKKEKKDDKKEKKDEKKDRSRHKIANDSSRHKRRRRSLSVDSKGRDTKHTNDEDYESSDDSRRKHHSRRRESPSPVRSKRRQVSRSPHSKHSQRRHSPYSSLDTSRRKRSRSRSPVRRKR